MKEKEIGVYVLCRIFPEGSAENYRRDAEFKCRKNIQPDSKNIHLYVDEVTIGEKSKRTALDNLFQDAMCGKLDHIIISDALDLWHSPEKVMDIIQKIKMLKKPITIQCFPTSLYWLMRNPVPYEDWEGSLIINSLRANNMVNEFQFLFDNYDCLNKEVRNGIIARHVDPDMFEEYLISYFLESKGIEIKDFAKMVNIRTDDIEIIKEAWCPSVKQQDMMIELFGKDFIAYYLA